MFVLWSNFTCGSHAFYMIFFTFYVKPINMPQFLLAILASTWIHSPSIRQVSNQIRLLFKNLSSQNTFVCIITSPAIISNRITFPSRNPIKSKSWKSSNKYLPYPSKRCILINNWAGLSRPILVDWPKNSQTIKQRQTQEQCGGPIKIRDNNKQAR